jgi:hypothetical protein
MNAVNESANFAEVRRLEQAIKNNPNDVDSQIKIAAMLTNLDLKRKLLNRTLSLDPTNQAAREMLLEMDRTELQGGHSQPAVQQTISASAPSRMEQPEKLLILRYSVIHRILIYPLLALASLLTLATIREWDVFIFFGACFLLLLIPTWFVTVVVEVKATGIKLYRLFRMYHQEVEWSEIEDIKPTAMGQGMRLTTADGHAIAVSSQIAQYPVIVEILRRLRPDLFDLANISSYENGFASGTKIFRKKFFAKYWLLIASIVLSLIFLGTVAAAQIVPAICMAIVLFLLWSSAINSAHTVTLEGNKLSTQSFRKKLEFTAQQIKNIGIVTVRDRRGVASNLIQIEMIDSNTFTLTRFPEGNEIMYGFLCNWWEHYKNA